MIILQNAGTESIELIRDITHKVWPIAYGDILSPAQLEYMLKLIYAPDALRQQMEDLHHQFILATEDGITIGFASFAPHRDEPTIYHLHKLYVLPGCQRKHVGKIMVDDIIQKIKNAGGLQLQLNVNRNNKALHFYKKLGFRIIKEEDIDIGEGYFMNDYVMGIEIVC